jgi:hypothetical protein
MEKFKFKLSINDRVRVLPHYNFHLMDECDRIRTVIAITVDPVFKNGVSVKVTGLDCAVDIGLIDKVIN